LVEGYSASAADASGRRKLASDIARKRVDKNLDFRDREIDVVTFPAEFPGDCSDRDARRGVRSPDAARSERHNVDVRDNSAIGAGVVVRTGNG
jgi:hypothetical protein